MIDRINLGHLWLRLSCRSRAGIARLDAFIATLTAAFLNNLLRRLVQSPWHDTAAVHRIVRRVQGRQEKDGRVQGIVSQLSSSRDTVSPAPDQSPAVAPIVARAVARGASFSFAGLLIVGIWWGMPSFERTVAAPPPQATVAAAIASTLSTTATPAGSTATAAPAATRGLAIVNPANVQAAQSTATATPTATPGAVLAALPAQPDTAAAPNMPSLVQPQSVAVSPYGEDTVITVDMGAATDSETFSAMSASVSKAIVASMLVPTPTFEPVPTVDVPFVQLVPEVEFRLPGTTPTPTPTLTPTPTPVPVILTAGRLWSNFQPRPAVENDHFWVERPFPDFVASQIASPSYQFGSTAGNRYRVHHGLDISNPVGTPVRAATSGEVVHAGWDDPDVLGPYGGFYGNAVVIRLDRRLPVAGGELDVFVLYGHLSEVLAAKGQRVGVEDIVGRVGMTGIAIGPHLHVEIRIGANTYQHSVNPDLWVRPSGDGGAVAVRVLTADGRTWAGARVSLARFSGSQAVWARQIETYTDTENIGPDPAWGENGAMGSIPPGQYVVAAQINGETLRTQIEVRPGETTFVELRTQQ